MEESKKYQLNTKDMKSVATGAYIAVGGALVTYIAEAIMTIDFGEYTPIVVAISSVVINAARKWLADNA
jgi:hypothetical protein